MDVKNMFSMPSEWCVRSKGMERERSKYVCVYVIESNDNNGRT